MANTQSQAARAEDDLVRSESMMRAILEAIPDVILRVGADGRFDAFHRAADSDSRVAPEHLPTGRLADIFPPEVAGPAGERLRAVLVSGLAQKLEYDVDLGGTPRSFEARFARIAPDQAVCVIRDVTETKRQARALTASESRFREALQDLTQVAVQAYDANGTITFWNRGSEALYGFAPAEAMGRDIVRLLHGHDTAAAQRRNMGAALRTGEPTDAGEIELVRKDGSRVSVYATNVLRRRADGRIEFFCFEVDVTARNAAELELRQKRKLEAIGQLASGVAHDFNNLLTAVFGHVELARSGLSAAHPAHRSLDAIAQAAADAGRITRALVTFSRRGHSQKTRVDVRALVEGVGPLIRPLLNESIRLELNVYAGAPLDVVGDDAGLQQALLMLAENARDAMPSGGRLGVCARRVGARLTRNGDEPEIGDAIEIAVSDDGAGMAGGVRERLFEPFFTTKPAGAGAGLGLSIVHGIVSDHGGRIDVQSTPGRGSTFTIYLPAAAPLVPEARPPGSSGRILVLAPNAQARGILVTALREQGFDVSAIATASDLNGAGESAAHGFRAAILDDAGCVPEALSGLAARLRTGVARMPIIVLHASGPAGRPVERDAGITHLVKPCAVSDLLRALRRQLPETAPDAQPHL